MSTVLKIVEVCPNCGDDTDFLSEIEGWCRDCVAIAAGRIAKQCDCGTWFLTNPLSPKYICPACRPKSNPKRIAVCVLCGVSFRTRGKSSFCPKPQCSLTRRRFAGYIAQGYSEEDALKAARFNPTDRNERRRTKAREDLNVSS